MEKRQHTEKEERLLRLIDKLHLSQKEFARKIGIKERTLHNYIHEDRFPAPDTLVKIRNEFQTNINWLLTGIGPMFISNKKVSELTDKEKELLLYFGSVGSPVQNGIIRCLKTVFSEQSRYVTK